MVPVSERCYVFTDITKHQLGYSVTVGIENSTPHKLQCVPLMTVNHTQDGLT